MPARRRTTIWIAAFICAALLSGCSGGASSSSSSAAGSSSGSTSASAAVSTSSESGSSSSSESGSSSNSASESESESSESESSSRSKTSSDDFNRALIGEWHIYSSETSKNATKKTTPERTAKMRKLGLHDTLTFSADGDVLVNKGGGKIIPYPWFATDDDNKFEIEGMLDDPEINGDEGETQVVAATLASGRLTLEYDSDDEGHVILVYSKS